MRHHATAQKYSVCEIHMFVHSPHRRANCVINASHVIANLLYCFFGDDVSKPDATKKNSTIRFMQPIYTLLLLHNWKICRSHSKH